jgi:hypothetical protein
MHVSSTSFALVEKRIALAACKILRLVLIDVAADHSMTSISRLSAN